MVTCHGEENPFISVMVTCHREENPFISVMVTCHREENPFISQSWGGKPIYLTVMGRTTHLSHCHGNLSWGGPGKAIYLTVMVTCNGEGKPIYLTATVTCHGEENSFISQSW